MGKLRFAFLSASLLLNNSCSAPRTRSISNTEQVKVTPDTVVAQSNQADEGLIRPEIVRSEEMRIVSGSKLLTVGNSHGHYHISCNAKLDSCVTLMPGKDYLVFTQTTRWKFPGATAVADLKFFQGFSVIYNNQENIALVPDGGGTFGMYILNSWDKN